MDKNFWTEENQILDFENLIGLDMSQKLLNMENQIVYGRDIFQSCYNYDYFISNKEKAIQFITDYSDEFVKSLNRYQRQFKKPFDGINNPVRVVNLMALHAGKDITRRSQLIRENWDKKMVLDSETVSALVKDINKVISAREKFQEKVFTTDETLIQVCDAHICYSLQSMIGKNDKLENLEKHLQVPMISEKTAKSLLKNSYYEIIQAVQETGVIPKGLLQLVECAISSKSSELLKDNFFLNNKNVIVTEAFVSALKDNLQVQSRPEVYLEPQKLQVIHQKQDLNKTPQKSEVREK